MSASDGTSGETFDAYQPDSGAAKGWQISERETLFDHAYIRVEEATFATPDRSEPVRWTIARRKAGVVVAPRLADGRFLLIRQERYPVERTLWEFPAGQIDDLENQDDEQTVRATGLRELQEECGHRLAANGALLSLGYFFSSHGFTDEHAYLFLATTVEPDPLGHSPDDAENILETRAFSLDELRAMIATNEIVDANTLAIFARLTARKLV